MPTSNGSGTCSGASPSARAGFHYPRSPGSPRPDTVRVSAARLHPEPVEPLPGRLGTAAYPLVRAPARARRAARGRDRAARDGAPLARPRPRVCRGALGRPFRARRRAAVPRGHGLVGALRRSLGAHPAGLGGRTRHLRGPVRRDARRRDRGPQVRHRAARPARLHRAGRGVRPGARALRQLLQPGAVRRTDAPALGPGDLAAEPPGRIHAVRDLPADLPVRVALVHRSGHGRPARVAARLATPAGRGAALPVPRAVLRRPLLRRGPADRPRARDRAAAAEPGRGSRGVRRRRRRVRRARAPRRACRGCGPSSSRAQAAAGSAPDWGGTTRRTVVPPPGVGSKRRVAPTPDARSRIASTPW